MGSDVFQNLDTYLDHELRNDPCRLRFASTRHAPALSRKRESVSLSRNPPDLRVVGAGAGRGEVPVLAAGEAGHVAVQEEEMRAT